MNAKVQKHNRYFYMMVGFLWLLIGSSLIVKASDSNSSEGVGFYFQTNKPVNQQQEGNFFDLVVDPGQHQVLETELINESDDDLTISVAINNATTTEKGVIDYSKNELKHTSNFTHKLTDMLKGPQEIILKKKEKKKLKLSLTIPDEPIEGMILGGVELKKKSTNLSANKGTTIHNEYAYVFSVALQMDKNKIEPRFSLNAPKTSQEDENTIVTISINNDSPSVVNQLIVESIIMPKDSDEVLAEYKLEEGKMAPLSIIEIPIVFESATQGTYRMATKLKLNDQTWQWVQPFEIKAKKSIIKETYTPVNLSKKSGLFMFFSCLLVGTTLMFYYLLRKAQH